MAVDPAFIKPMSTLGKVTPNTRAKAIEILKHCKTEVGRVPGVLWGMGPGKEHGSGRALDIMISHHGYGTDRAMGDAVVDFVLKNGDDWGLGWVIWRQRIYPSSGRFIDNPNGGWRKMADRGNSTKNHYDHPHIYFASDLFSEPTKAKEEDMTPEQFSEMMGVLRSIDNRIAYLEDEITDGKEGVKHTGQMFGIVRDIRNLLSPGKAGSHHAGPLYSVVNDVAEALGSRSEGLESE